MPFASHHHSQHFTNINSSFQHSEVDSITIFVSWLRKLRHRGIKELSKLTRNYSFTENSVTVCDNLEIEGDFALTERLVCYKEPTIKDGEVIVGKAHIKFDTNLLEASYSTDTHTLECEVDGSIKRGVTVYLIDLKLKTQDKSVSFTVEIE